MATAEAGFTKAEKAAMRERVKEAKAEQRKADGEAAVLEKVREMPQPDRGIAEAVHAVVRSVAPELVPRTWYGMPAYTKDDKVVCYVKPAAKFGARYTTFGFEDKAALDDGAIWPTCFGITEMTPDAERQIAALVRRAAG